MGMGVGGYIHLGSGLHAGPTSICQDSVLASWPGWKLDINSALSISPNYPMVFAPERDDCFGIDRYGNAAFPCGLSKEEGLGG